MATLGLMAALAATSVGSACMALRYSYLKRPWREQQLRRQVQALQSALEITQHAWAARSAMHAEADAVRKKRQEPVQTEAVRRDDSGSGQ